jgi:hypothetical protein
MGRSIKTVWAAMCFIATWGAGACSAKTDTATSTGGGSGGALSTGTGAGSSTTTGSGCATNYSPCGSLCCAPGKLCSSPGHCDFPYNTAELYVYLCPSFNTGNCKAAYLGIDQSCTPLHDPQPGTCYDTGFKVAGGQSYGISACTGCSMGCGNPSSVTTPAGFTKPNYFSGMAFYCGTPCTAPPDCGQAANAGGPGATPDGGLIGPSTGSATTGTGGAGGSSGSTGAGGSFGTGTGGGSDICAVSGSTKECSQMVSCPNCSFQSCSCFDGSNCSAGYHTSDGLDFPCASCPNGCTVAAQAVVVHCGCAM